MQSRFRIPCLLIAAAALLFSVACPATEAVAQNGDGHSGSFIISPFAAAAFPTGRFGETDPDAEPPKSGHESGLAFGGDAGFYLTEGLLVGVGVRTVGFDIDFGPEIEAQFPAKSAKTKVLLAEVWGRWFLTRPFERWRPYIVGAIGVGRPKGTIEYEDPFIITLPEDQGTIEVQSLESTVKTTVLVSGGIGVLVPVSTLIGINFEPRYTMISTKGTTRTDEYRTSGGEVTEIEDTAKSNTNWWEVRGGIVITIP